jgi:hypothetical protein
MLDKATVTIDMNAVTVTNVLGCSIMSEHQIRNNTANAIFSSPRTKLTMCILDPAFSVSLREKVWNLRLLPPSGCRCGACPLLWYDLPPERAKTLARIAGESPDFASAVAGGALLTSHALNHFSAFVWLFSAEPPCTVAPLALRRKAFQTLFLYF